MSVEKSSEGMGQPVRRKEDQRFITGQGRYTADIRIDGEIHAAFVRSPHAHARLVSIDIAAALEVDGVIAVLTGADMAADNVGALPLDFAARNFDGKPMAIPPRYPLSRDEVRYVGEPVAVVIAETDKSAQDGVEAVAVDFDELPVIVDLATAATDAAPSVHE